jgi:hypothetical protein
VAIFHNKVILKCSPKGEGVNPIPLSYIKEKEMGSVIKYSYGTTYDIKTGLQTPIVNTDTENGQDTFSMSIQNMPDKALVYVVYNTDKKQCIPVALSKDGHHTCPLNERYGNIEEDSDKDNFYPYKKVFSYTWKATRGVIGDEINFTRMNEDGKLAQFKPNFLPSPIRVAISKSGETTPDVSNEHGAQTIVIEFLSKYAGNQSKSSIPLETPKVEFDNKGKEEMIEESITKTTEKNDILRASTLSSTLITDTEQENAFLKMKYPDTSLKIIKFKISCLKGEWNNALNVFNDIEKNDVDILKEHGKNIWNELMDKIVTVQKTLFDQEEGKKWKTAIQKVKGDSSQWEIIHALYPLITKKYDYLLKKDSNLAEMLKAENEVAFKKLVGEDSDSDEDDNSDE